MRPVQRGLVLVLIGVGALFLKGSHQTYAGVPSGNPFAPLPQIVGAASVPMGDNIQMLLADIDRQGIVHVFFSTLNPSPEPPPTTATVWYTNNNSPGQKGGWAPPFIVNTGQPEALDPVGRKPDLVDSQGNAHIAWVAGNNEYEVAPNGDGSLADFTSRINNVRSRRRNANGSWNPAVNLTNNQAIQATTDSSFCRFESGIPLFGRQWWVKAMPLNLDFSPLPDGTAIVVWRDQWWRRAFNGGMGCDEEGPPSLPQYSGTKLVSVRTGGVPVRQVIADYPGGAGFYMTTMDVDSAGTPHLLFVVQPFDPILPPTQLMYTRRTGSTWTPAMERLMGADDCFDLEISADNTLNVFWMRDDVSGVIWQKVQNDDWTQPGATTPIPRECPLTISAELLDVVLDQNDEPVVSFNDGTFLPPVTPGQGIYRHANNAWYFEPTVILQNQIFVNQSNLVASVQRTFATPPPVGMFENEGLLLRQQAYIDHHQDPSSITPLGQGLTANRTNGDVNFSLPLFGTAGKGIPLDIKLNFKSRGVLDRPPGEEPLGQGWYLSPMMRMFTDTAGDILYSDDPEHHAMAWLIDGTGGGTALRVEGPPPPRDSYFETHKNYSWYLRATVLPSGAWTDMDGEGSRYDFLPSGAISTITDPNGNQLRYSYGDNTSVPGIQQNLTTITDSVGRQANFRYNSNNNIDQITDPENRTWTLTYYPPDDPSGCPGQRCLRQVIRDFDQATWTFSYHRTSGTYRATDGALASITDPEGNVTQFSYTPGGRLSRVMDPQSQPTTIEYRSTRMLREPDEFLEYEDFDTILTDARNNQTQTHAAYDFEYYLLSDVLVSPAYNVRHEYFWPTSEFTFTDSQGQMSRRTYKTFRRMTSDQDFRGNVTSYDYYPEQPLDIVKFDLGRINQPGVPPTEFAWTADNEVERITDPRGMITRYEYFDPFNPHLPTEIIQPPDGCCRNPTTMLSWDGFGRLRTVTDPQTRTTTFNYNEGGDSTGLPTSITRPDTLGLEKLTYTPSGLVKTHKPPVQIDPQATHYEYDSANRPIRTIFPDPGTGDHGSSQVVNTYDLNGNLKTFTDQLGKVTTYTYDSRNRLIRTARHDGTFSTVEYNENGYIKAKVDFNSHRTEYDYDERNRLKEERLPEGMKTRFAYDANGNRTQRKEVSNGGSERITTYQYDVLNRLTVVRDPAPFNTQTESYTYDNNGNVLTLTDRRGNVTTNTYTDRNLLKSVKRPGAVTGDPAEAYRTDFTYDLNGNRLITTVWRKDGGTWQPHTTTNTYDGRNRLSTTTDPLSRTVTNTYDDNGRLIETRDPAGMVTKTVYDALNRPKTVTQDYGTGRLNLQSMTTFDTIGNVLKIRDAEGKETNNTYDDLHRLRTVTSPLGQVAAYTYDANGNRRTVQNANNQVTEYLYDGQNRLVRNIDATGTVTLINTYDEFGDRRSRTDGNGTMTTYSYDELHRLTNTTYSPTNIILRTYDAAGNITGMSDPNTNNTYTYDALNRLTREASSILNRSAEYEYDSFDNRILLRGLRGQTVTGTNAYSYDAVGQLDTINVDGASFSFNFDYNADGTRSRLTRPNGSYTEHLYDSAKRLNTLNNRHQSNSIISGYQYQYNRVGNRTRADVTIDGSANHMLQYTYDDLYRLTSETRTGAHPYTNSWTYDLVGNRLTENRNGMVSPYAYDSDNQLVSRTTPRALIISDDFNAPPLTDKWTVQSGTWSESNGTLKASHSTARALLQENGITASDANAKVNVKVTNSNYHGLAFHIQNPSDYLAVEMRMKPLKSGIQKIPEDGPMFIDVQLQLVRVQGATTSVLAGTTFQAEIPWATLEVNVNGSSVGMSVNGEHKLSKSNLPLSSGGIGLEAFRSGEFDDFQSATDLATGYAYDANGNLTRRGSETLTYDAENRLTRYTNGATMATYIYDALGRRIKKDINGSIEQYAYVGEDIALDLDVNGNEVAAYLNALGTDQKLAMRRGGVGYDIFTDALGSVREITSGQTGVVQNRYDEDAFGNRLSATGSIVNRYGFTQRENDSESGLMHYRARTYDPIIGRFVQRDPVAANVPTEHYAYVGNNPASRIDPMGLQEDPYANDPFLGSSRQEASLQADRLEALIKEKAQSGDVIGRVGSKLLANFLNDPLSHVGIIEKVGGEVFVHQVTVPSGYEKIGIREFIRGAVYLKSVRLWRSSAGHGQEVVDNAKKIGPTIKGYNYLATLEGGNEISDKVLNAAGVCSCTGFVQKAFGNRLVAPEPRSDPRLREYVEKFFSYKIPKLDVSFNDFLVGQVYKELIETKSAKAFKPITIFGTDVGWMTDLNALEVGVNNAVVKFKQDLYDYVSPYRLVTESRGRSLPLLVREGFWLHQLKLVEAPGAPFFQEVRLDR